MPAEAGTTGRGGVRAASGRGHHGAAGDAGTAGRRRRGGGGGGHRRHRSGTSGRVAARDGRRAAPAAPPAGAAAADSSRRGARAAPAAARAPRRRRQRGTRRRRRPGTGGAAGAAAPVAGPEAAGVRLFGRADIGNAAQPRFSWSGTGFVARFSGTGLTARLNNTASFHLQGGRRRHAEGRVHGHHRRRELRPRHRPAAGTHTVELYRQTEGGQGDSQLRSLTVARRIPDVAPAGSGAPHRGAWAIRSARGMESRHADDADASRPRVTGTRTNRSPRAPSAPKSARSPHRATAWSATTAAT